MKFVLLSVVCLFGVVLAKPALPKYKRDILPGDSRYGTDYHLNHHHAHQSNDNEVEIAQSVGGYAGSYIVRENTVPQHDAVNFQSSQASYGPPNHSAGTPIHYAAPQVQKVQQAQPAQQVVTVSHSYLAPAKPAQAPVVQQSAPVVHHQPAPVAYQPAPVVYQPAPVVHQPAPAVQHTHDVPNDYLPPAQIAPQKSVQTITSYGTPVPQNQVVAAQPAVEYHEVQHVQEVAQEAPVQQQEVVQQAPAQQVVHHQEVHVYHHAAPAQQEVQTYHQEAPAQHAPQVQHVQQEQVSHVQHVVQQPAVQQQVVHHVVKQPAVQHHVQQVVQQPAVQHHIVQQPAVQHQVVYQAAPAAQAPQADNSYNSGADNLEAVFSSDANLQQVANVYENPQQNVQAQAPQQQQAQFASNEPTQQLGSNGGYVY